MSKVMETAVESRFHPRAVACSLACMNSGMDSDMMVGMSLPTKNRTCLKGYSSLQINIMATLKSYPDVISFWQIAHVLNAHFDSSITEDAVRGALARLYKRGFIIRQRKRRGNIRGNAYAFTEDPCLHILPFEKLGKFDGESGVVKAVQSSHDKPRSILKKTEMNILSLSSSEYGEVKVAKTLESITEDDIAFHWPILSSHGFTTDQIRQIIMRLTKLGKGVRHILQGLTHAEWELSRGIMRDQHNAQVNKPLEYVFVALATNGYYRRPDGYRSPEEQAELDMAEEHKCLTKAYKDRQEAEADAWIARLSPEERNKILGPSSGQLRMPPDTELRLYFKQHIWPATIKNQKEGQNVPTK